MAAIKTQAELRQALRGSAGMNTREQIEQYLDGQPEPKRSDMQELHRRILKRRPKLKLWFMDGTDEEGRTVSNPSVGYGLQTIRYANGRSKEFYRVGISANTAGISVYILGLDDKKYQAQTYGKRLGKATVTGYCIKFKRLEDIDVEVLDEALQFGLEQPET
jgi:hypothetical protein